MRTRSTIIFIALFCSSLVAETKIPDSSFPPVDELPPIEGLPDPFTFFNSTRKVTNLENWEERRNEMRALLMEYEYGTIPPIETNASGKIVDSTSMYGGKATLYHARIAFGPDKAIQTDVRWIQPNGEGPFPMFVMTKYRPSIEEDARIEAIIDRGYIVAEWYIYDLQERNTSDGQVKAAFPEYSFGTIGRWAWGGSACFDYFRKISSVDPEKIIFTGLSRSGKTVLLMGAIDDRIPLIVPACTGLAGAGIYRFNPKEWAHTISKSIKTPNQRALYSEKLTEFAGRETHMPFDQHFLPALMAPRPMLLIIGESDTYDRNTLIQYGYSGAKPVYEWLGAGENLGFYAHSYGHAYNPEDWEVTMDFAEKLWKGKDSPKGHEFYSLPYPEIDLYHWTVPGTTTEE